MDKVEVIVEGGDSVMFDGLTEAKAAGRELHRRGRTVYIEVSPESVPGQRTGWRYEPDSDEWFMVALPQNQDVNGAQRLSSSP